MYGQNPHYRLAETSYARMIGYSTPISGKIPGTANYLQPMFIDMNPYNGNTGIPSYPSLNTPAITGAHFYDYNNPQAYYGCYPGNDFGTYNRSQHGYSIYPQQNYPTQTYPQQNYSTQQQFPGFYCWPSLPQQPNSYITTYQTQVSSFGNWINQAFGNFMSGLCGLF